MKTQIQQDREDRVLRDLEKVCAAFLESEPSVWLSYNRFSMNMVSILNRSRILQKEGQGEREPIGVNEIRSGGNRNDNDRRRPEGKGRIREGKGKPTALDTYKP